VQSASDSVEKERSEDGGVSEGTAQKIIRTVTLSIIVPDVEKTVTEIEAMLKKVNGYVQDANLWQSDNNLQGHLTLRVPSSEVDGFIPRLESLGRVERKNVSGQDVTEEYYDVEARKNNLKKQEARYLELLDKANTVKEMLEIESELARVRGEIESMEARLKVLDNRVDLATITLELQAPKSLSTGETLREPFGERIQTGWQRGINGMMNFVQDLVVLFVILLPYTPMLALLGYTVYRVRKSRRLFKNRNGDQDGN
ncbi:MAG: DUF4349 domain-containing protein, partial [Desulfotomaculaceae bacterium]